MIKYYIWLQTVLGAGNTRTVKILNFFGSPKNIFNACNSTRKKSGLFTQKELLVAEKTNISNALEIIELCRKNKINIITYGSELYPKGLEVLPDAPLLLYVKGKIPDFNKIPVISIVGPRKVSDFGKKAAYSLSYRLAASGFVIVSGGALGADTYAHAGALKANGKTVLCLGCGILSDYLSENKKLREAITENGCLISEYPPNAEATKYNFPIRNRIISALSLGTVVIEAGIKSGALITARHAYEQGRDVFVIPGSPDNKNYAGSNSLLRDGAKPILDASDIFNEYITRFPDKIFIDKAYEKPIISKNKLNHASKMSIQKLKTEKTEKNFYETLSKEAKIVYNYLDKQKFLPEEIKNTGLSSQQLLAALTELEMEFLIRALPGGMFEKIS